MFEEVMGFFETMADDIGYIRLQEITFEHLTVVQSAVEALYGAMLKFWVEAVKYYRSKQSDAFEIGSMPWTTRPIFMPPSTVTTKGRATTAAAAPAVHDVALVAPAAVDTAPPAISSAPVPAASPSPCALCVPSEQSASESRHALGSFGMPLAWHVGILNAKDLEKRVNDAVFPACQGGPHNNTIAAITTSLLQVIANAQTLGVTLISHGYKLQTNGTDNHLVLWDLCPSKVEKVCDLMGITINKNAISGDASAQVPGGIRIGTSALTSRNMREEEMKIVANFLHRIVQLSLHLQKEADSKLLKDFVCVATNQEEGKTGFAQVKQLRDEVRAFASQ
ncbi:hypothetical protein C0991_005217 [Blastosporella zonata]|nr:hypothetical protein C0991_005217 [Blastosporella zonata]